MIDHRTFVARGVSDPWAVNDGKDVLELLKRHGLMPGHRLLDFGCGPLRVGRWLIEYLSASRYFGIDPNAWLIEAAKKHEVSARVLKEKRPRFDTNGEFNLNVFGVKFDYVVISNVLLHAADWQLARIISGMGAVLARGGVGLGNIVYAAHYDGDEWLYPGIAGHSLECLAGPAAIAGLKCEAVDTIEGSGLSLHWFKFRRQGGSSG